MPIKYPLQIEIEKDLQESVKILGDVLTSNDATLIEVANKYYNAIKRINDICVNRNRF